MLVAELEPVLLRRRCIRWADDGTIACERDGRWFLSVGLLRCPLCCLSLSQAGLLASSVVHWQAVLGWVRWRPSERAVWVRSCWLRGWSSVQIHVPVLGVRSSMVGKVIRLVRRLDGATRCCMSEGEEVGGGRSVG